MGIHVAQFLKRVNISKYFCSSRVGFNKAIYKKSVKTYLQ